MDTIGFTVSDMDRSVDFFTRVLAFQKNSEVEVTGEENERLQGVFGLRMRLVRLSLREESIELTEYFAPKGKPFPPDTRGNDRWFHHIAIIVSDMDRAYQILRQHKVTQAFTEPQTLPEWNKNAAGIKAFYFRDPDGHYLEILQFPPGKGDPKWQRKDRLFLGVDHAAIVVGDTETSLKFYRDLLGLQVIGESENYGTEQEHLNNVFGARLRITTLRAASGPAIEFLEYLSRRDGRPYRPDAHANDLVHWQTKLVARDAVPAAGKLREPKATFISPGLVRLTTKDLPFTQGVLFRDPDGHALALTAK